MQRRTELARVQMLVEATASSCIHNQALQVVCVPVKDISANLVRAEGPSEAVKLQACCDSRLSNQSIVLSLIWCLQYLVPS